mmetsp:Transcript_14648/g.22919  ORF Transcript_14648/g.22919 Transcript_14648/m.22919 type:complete len:89 (-) Transcript_14648:407-673(-)
MQSMPQAIFYESKLAISSQSQTHMMHHEESHHVESRVCLRKFAQAWFLLSNLFIFFSFLLLFAAENIKLHYICIANGNGIESPWWFHR